LQGLILLHLFFRYTQRPYLFYWKGIKETKSDDEISKIFNFEPNDKIFQWTCNQKSGSEILLISNTRPRPADSFALTLSSTRTIALKALDEDGEKASLIHNKEELEGISKRNFD